MTKTNEDERFGWAETAVILGCSISTLQRLRAAGLIGCTTVGLGKRPRVFFSRKQIDQYIASATRDATAKR